MAKLEYRYQGKPPKVGIRPTVDGRLGGAREDMEGRTLAMARRVSIGAPSAAVSGDRPSILHAPAPTRSTFTTRPRERPLDVL